VALVGEPGLGRHLGQRRPGPDRGPGQVEAAQRAVPVRAGAVGPAELAGQPIPVDAGDPFQGRRGGLLPGVGVQVAAGGGDRGQVDRARRRF